MNTVQLIYFIGCIIGWCVFIGTRVRKSRSRKMLSGGSSSSSSTASGKIGGKPDYHKIARLEIEMFGQTQLCEGSPIPAGRTNVYGVTSDGHMPDGSCNVNASIGPTCSKFTHRKRTRMPPSYYDPYADWTDEDRRPW